MKHSLQLTSTEENMLQDIFTVMSKYKGKTRHFGVQLVHSHFQIKKNEVLYETHNTEKRMLKVSPVKINAFVKAPLATAWQFSKSGKITVAMFCCDRPKETDL